MLNKFQCAVSLTVLLDRSHDNYGSNLSSWRTLPRAVDCFPEKKNLKKRKKRNFHLEKLGENWKGKKLMCNYKGYTSSKVLMESLVQAPNDFFGPRHFPGVHYSSRGEHPEGSCYVVTPN